MKKRLVLGCVIMGFFAAASFAGGRHENSTGTSGTADRLRNGDTVVIEGVIHLVGSATFSSMVIVDKDGTQWYLADDNDLANEIHPQSYIRIKGTVEKKVMKLANGRRLPDRLYLHKIKLMSE